MKALKLIFALAALSFAAVGMAQLKHKPFAGKQPMVQEIPVPDHVAKRWDWLEASKRRAGI